MMKQSLESTRFNLIFVLNKKINQKGMNIHVSRQPEALKIAKKTSHSAKTSLK